MTSLSKENFYQEVGDYDTIWDNCVVLGGGTDVSAGLFGQTKHKQAQTPDMTRDYQCIDYILYARARKLPVIGICRGSHILGAYNNQGFFQHVVGENHTNVAIFDEQMGLKSINTVASDHHQALVLKADNVIKVATSQNPVSVIDFDGTIGSSHYLCPQITFFPKYKHFAIQFHPEWMGKGSSMNTWVCNLIEKYPGLKNIL